MRQKYDSDIKLNEFGNPDVDFYISEAKRLRVQACSALIQGFLGWLKRAVGKGQSLPMRTVH